MGAVWAATAASMASSDADSTMIPTPNLDLLSLWSVVGSREPRSARKVSN